MGMVPEKLLLIEVSVQVPSSNFSFWWRVNPGPWMQAFDLLQCLLGNIIDTLIEG
jgi:hypothetical protein